MRLILDSGPSVFICLVGLLGYFVCYRDIFFLYRECNIVKNKGYTVVSKSGLNIIQLTLFIRSEIKPTLLLNPYSIINTLLVRERISSYGSQELRRGNGEG